jgi:hypothetical protein
VTASAWNIQISNDAAKVGERMRAGRRTISVPSVPSMADADSGRRPPVERTPHERKPIDPARVQYLDRVRAVFRPTESDALAPGVKRFVGREDIFRHVGTADTGSHGVQPMMQCPSYWPDSARWVPIRDLEILEILEDQDVRAG